MKKLEDFTVVLILLLLITAVVAGCRMAGTNTVRVTRCQNIAEAIYTADLIYCEQGKEVMRGARGEVGVAP